MADFTCRRTLPLTVVALAALTLAACASDSEAERRICPSPILVEDAADLTRFDGAGRDLTDVEFEASIEEATLACSFDDDENVIEADMGVVITASRGPANIGNQADLRYFVAVATRDQRVLSRDSFDLNIPFEGNRTRVAARDELAPRIPIQPDEDGRDYRIYIGFVLTPEELQYNRDNR